MRTYTTKGDRLRRNISVSRYETIRTLLAASMNEEMHVHQMDIMSAYIQGELSNEESKVCKLIKPLYNSKQSGREWYRTFDKYVTNREKNEQWLIHVCICLAKVMTELLCR